MLKYIRTPITYIQETYENIIHYGDVDQYPLLDRVISALPLIGTIIASTILETSIPSKNITGHLISDIAAACGLYTVSQIALTTAKSYTEDFEDGMLKSFINKTITIADIFNNILLQAPISTLLSKTMCLHKIGAFTMLPELLKVIESDIKVSIQKLQGKDIAFEQETAGIIWAKSIAALIAKNATEEITKLIYTAPDKDKGDNIPHGKVEADVIANLVGSLADAVFNKILIGKTYSKNEFTKDVVRNLVSDYVYLCDFGIGAAVKDSKLNDTIFAIAPQFALFEIAQHIAFNELPSLFEDDFTDDIKVEEVFTSIGEL